MAKRAMEVFQSMAEKSGGILLYNKEVSNVTKNEVTLIDGTVYSVKQVVVTAGPQTVLQGFDDLQTGIVKETEYYVFGKREGLPPCMFEFMENGDSYYGCGHLEDLSQYKIGFHTN